MTLKSQPTENESKRLMADEICNEVLGTTSGYIRGLGHGVKPSFSSTTRIISEQRVWEAQLTAKEAQHRAEVAERRAEVVEKQVEEAERRAQELTEKFEAQNIEFNNLKAKFSSFESWLNSFGSRLPTS